MIIAINNNNFETILFESFEKYKEYCISNIKNKTKKADWFIDNTLYDVQFGEEVSDDNILGDEFFEFHQELYKLEEKYELVFNIF